MAETQTQTSLQDTQTIETQTSLEVTTVTALIETRSNGAVPRHNNHHASRTSPPCSHASPPHCRASPPHCRASPTHSRASPVHNRASPTPLPAPRHTRKRSVPDLATVRADSEAQQPYQVSRRT